MFSKRKLKEEPAAPPVPAAPTPPAPPKRAPLRSPATSAKPVAPPPPPPPTRVKRPRGGILSATSEFLTLALVIGGVITFGLLVLDQEVQAPGPLQQDKIVLVPRGSGTSEIAALLNREGVIASPTLFELYAYLNRSKGGQLKAGEFQFKAGVDIADAIDTLVNGKAILHSVTIPEGLTSEQMVDRLRENDVLAGTLNDTPREGSLLPDTYRFERGTTRQQLVNIMQAAARDSLNKAWQKRAGDLPIRTPQELLILASIVEKETGRGDERARVAGVFLNRLARRMKLQSDPTIVYGIVGGKGTLGRGITRAEIDRATPYNTYAIEGLPPGPIANPGRAAIEAVANPAKTKELFFVADGTGGHAFAETYEQHQRNVARWRQIEAARQTGAPNPLDVDRAAPATMPDQRTMLDEDAEPPTRAASGSTFIDSTPPTVQASRRAFDASEGTARDPLSNQSWDLTSAKTVPAFGPDPTPVAASVRRREPARRAAPARRAEAGAEAPPSR